MEQIKGGVSQTGKRFQAFSDLSSCTAVVQRSGFHYVRVRYLL